MKLGEGGGRRGRVDTRSHMCVIAPIICRLQIPHLGYRSHVIEEEIILNMILSASQEGITQSVNLSVILIYLHPGLS